MIELDKIKASLKWLKPETEDARKIAAERPETKIAEASEKKVVESSP